MRPLEFGLGWRATPLGRSGRVVPYAAGGLLIMGYQETSEFADDEENVERTFNGFSFLGGIEIRLAPWVIAGAEAQYRSIPDAIGAGGVSQAFDETDLGGFTFRVLVGLGR
jgi:hypothetical protein